MNSFSKSRPSRDHVQTYQAICIHLRNNTILDKKPRLATEGALSHSNLDRFFALSFHLSRFSCMLGSQVGSDSGRPVADTHGH